MVITQVDAQVGPERWRELRDQYRSMAGSLEPGIVRTDLLQDAEDRTHWRVATVWKSMEALDEYRRSVEAPGAFLLFQNVGAEPSRAIFEVAEFASGDA